MKKYFNKTLGSIVIGVALLTACLFAKADSLTVIFGGTNNSALLYRGPADINGVTIYNPTTNPCTVSFFDSPTNVIFYTNGAYTNFTINSVTYTNIYTNYFGVITTNTYPSKSNAVNVVAGGTNNYPTNLTLNIPTSGYVSSTIKFPIANGLFATNVLSGAATNLIITLDISKRN